MRIKNRPNLIVLDVLKPHTDGRELLRHLGQRDDWMPPSYPI
jgi:CheY-like chemotaxis protein